MKNQTSCNRPILNWLPQSRSLSRLRHFSQVLLLLVSLVGTVGSSLGQSCVCMDPSAISWWKGQNNANDSVGANHGVLIGGATFAGGHVGQAFSLDGIDDYVSIPDSPSLRPVNLTVEGWFNFATIDSIQLGVSKPVGPGYNNSFQIAVENGALKACVGTLNEFSEFLTAPIAAGQWYHIALTFDDTADLLSLYVNGILMDSSATTLTIEYDDHPVFLGADDEGFAGGITWFYSGSIDEVTIYSTALTAAQILGIHAAGTTGKGGNSPVISALPAPSSISCPLVPVFATATVSDDCDPSPSLTFADVTTAGICPQEYTVTRTWTATDSCGNITTATQVITVEDNTGPVISALPVASTILCPGIPSFATPTATDNCDPAPTLTFADVTTPGICVQEYSVTRTWTATDVCGNISTATQTISVDDAIAPVISALPAPTTITCPAAPVFTTPTATDNCDATPTLTFTDSTTANCPHHYSLTRTWTATDDCGNTSTATQTILVEDTSAPVISALPGVSTVECSPTLPFATPTAVDNCDSAPALTFVDVTTTGTCAHKFSITRTWTATDACGNSSTAMQTIIVTDTTAPVISALPAPSTIACTVTPGFATPTATDSCDLAPTLTFLDVTTPSVACAQTYSVTRTWTATDACGNTSTATETISVQDTVAPVISAVPTPTVIQCPSVPSFATPTVTDNCDLAPSMTFADVTTAGSCAQESSVTRTWTATDACGNVSTATQTISIEDGTAPVISALPGPMTVQCTGVPPFTTPTATDACDAAPTLTFSDATTAGACPVFTVTRTWTATDACGNTSTATQTLMLEDTTAPTVACPADRTIDCDDSTAPTTTGFPTVTDCDPNPTVTFTDVVVAGSCPNTSVITRTWKAVDACNNQTTCEQTIIVADNTAPLLTCPPNISVSTTPGQCVATVNVVAPLATDSCDPAPTVSGARSDGEALNAVYPLGTTTITWSAFDCAGNLVSCPQTVTVNDTTPPTLACPANITDGTDPGQCAAVVSYPAPTATDLCSGVGAVVCTPPSGSSFPVGTTSVNCSVADTAGNPATCSFTVTVVDSQTPVIVCSPTLNIISPTPAGVVVNFANPAVSDNCGASVLCLPSPGSTFPIGTNIISCMAMDLAGNSGTCTFAIIVSGSTPRTSKIQVRNELVALLGTISNSSDRSRLTDAINHLNKSLDNRRWADDRHLTRNQGSGVFSEEKKTVDQLRRLRILNNSGIAAAVWQGFINRLVAVDRELLVITIADAIARGAQAGKINSANNELGRGDAAAAADNPVDAIERYKQGWADLK